jgi:chromosome partitioning protein
MAKRIVFFNNKGGIGKTTLIYHTAYMLNELGYKVLVADFDPQTNLTAMLLPQERLEEIFLIPQNKTVTDAMLPVFENKSYQSVHIERVITESFLDMFLIVGNLTLSTYEDAFSDAWAKGLNSEIQAFQKTIIFDTMLHDAEQQSDADYTLIDIGTNLGAINRAVWTAVDTIILPIGADLFSLQDIKNLGATLKIWKHDWLQRIEKKLIHTRFKKNQLQINVIGYIILQHTAKESRPMQAAFKWIHKIPKTYKIAILGQAVEAESFLEKDTNCLGLLRHYNGLMPLAIAARKPIFLLKPVDGVFGVQFQAVQRVYQEFQTITKRIIKACNS